MEAIVPTGAADDDIRAPLESRSNVIKLLIDAIPHSSTHPSRSLSF